MHVSLFTTLAKWAPHSGENFCTDALAWTLHHDAVARRELLRKCLESCGEARPSSRSTIEALSRSASIAVSTQKRVVIEDQPRRWIQPDLWIEDTAAGLCLLVEIKVWARATMRRRGRTNEDDGEDEASELVSQTAEYRRWLDKNRPGAGALVALTILPDNSSLTKDCDGSFVWGQLHAALKQTSVGDLTKQLCTYLEDVGMVTKEFELDERGLVGEYIPPAWDALQALLAEVVTQLGSIGNSAKLSGSPYLSIYPSTEGLLLWSRWLRMSGPKGAWWITPYFRLRSDNDRTALQFLIGLSGPVQAVDIKTIAPPSRGGRIQ
jgi:hypothetical protein